jgi:hypothetical protein
MTYLVIAAVVISLVGLSMAGYLRWAKKHAESGVSYRGDLRVEITRFLSQFLGISQSVPDTTPEPEKASRQLGGAMVALGFLLGSLSVFLRKDLTGATYWMYLPFLAAGLLLFAGGVYLASRLERGAFFEPILRRIASGMGIHPAQVVCLAAAIIAALLATLAAGTNPRLVSPAVAVTAWVSGILLAVIGGWQKTVNGGRRPFPCDALAWATGLTLIALLLRAVSIGRIPVVLAGDEASVGFDALAILKGSVNNPFGIFGWLPFPSLYTFIQAAGIFLFGRTIEALRYPSALAGALSVGGLYLLVRSSSPRSTCTSSSAAWA